MKKNVINVAVCISCMPPRPQHAIDAERQPSNMLREAIDWDGNPKPERKPKWEEEVIKNDW